ncbi:MAG: glycosyltransferase [Solirubrobacterales bacterium]
MSSGTAGGAGPGVRVLIAHNRYRRQGGEERHVELLERGLAEAGTAVRRFELEGTELDRSPVRRAAAGLVLAYRPGASGIGRVIEDWRPSVVHFHNLWPLLTPSALRLARRSGAAVVLTAHNYRFACPGGTLQHGGMNHEDCIDGSSLRCAIRDPRGNRLESLAYGIALEVQRRLGMLRRWVDAFVAPSAFMAGMLIRSGLPGNRVHVIPYGLPVRADPPPPGRSFALFLGRLVPEKGVRTLLSAGHLAPEVPLAIGGEGPLAAEVRRDGPGTRYLGALDRADADQALRDAAFTLVPSEWHENLPFSALESLAAGRAVVATRMGGLPEIVDDGETGLLVAPGEPTALAAAMSRLWRDPERLTAMGRRGAEVAAARYSLRNQTARLLDLYRRLPRASREPALSRDPVA